VRDSSLFNDVNYDEYIKDNNYVDNKNCLDRSDYNSYNSMFSNYINFDSSKTKNENLFDLAKKIKKDLNSQKFLII